MGLRREDRLRPLLNRVCVSRLSRLNSAPRLRRRGPAPRVTMSGDLRTRRSWGPIEGNLLISSAQFVPKKIFFTKGSGTHREKLVSFEMALRDAGIAQHNLVRVSSIFPPNCEIVEREEGVKLLTPGQIVFCVLSEAATNEPGRRVGAAVGVAMPKDRSMYGYISEHHAHSSSEVEIGDYTEDLAAQMLATVLGAPFDPDEAWDERKEQWRLSGLVVNTMNQTCVSEGPETGEWVTVVSAAVVCG